MATAVRGFSHFNEAWYANAARTPGENDSISIGWYYPDGGCDGEFSVKWTTLSSRSVPQVCMFSDSWACYRSMDDLFAALVEHNDRDIQPKEFCELLLSLGFTDLTKRDNPYQPEKSSLIAAAKQKLTAEEYAAIASSSN